jgi:hypothetical protein
MFMFVPARGTQFWDARATQLQVDSLARRSLVYFRVDRRVPKGKAPQQDGKALPAAARLN